ncbi:L-arabinolactonase [Andreprevotia sp. IGB-42]|uniref:SMP-30/gluconolactonase/LRE family protein n=1 Tax=Andreprevotia sp. IGB-42 TaxID=2497473 RepID=UPI001358D508|nr:SMP-30/gluconolactonase/LRE family protein [Andreprevotia sp. IGB-42]KAF0814480.1 L-arabinolactonase [Andreprevotia sp. IGB-42]
MHNVQPISPSRFNLGEGILWDDRLQVVWWTDIHAATLWQYSPATRAERSWPLRERLGCFALTATDGVLLLGLERGLARFDAGSGELAHLQDVEPEYPKTRINDGRCDRAGNFVFGTLNEGGPEPIGAFYRYGVDGSLQKLALPGCAIANSICFSPDGGTLYFTDSPTKCIMACDYDAASGNTERIRLFADATHQRSNAPDPDGSIVDAAGHLWNAEWGGNRVVRYTPAGEIEREIRLPASQATCLTFAGATLDTLYITTARAGMSDTALAQEATAGAVFTAQPDGIHGLPEPRYGGSLR